MPRVMQNNNMLVFCNEQHVNLKAIYSISMNRATSKVFSVQCCFSKPIVTRFFRLFFSTYKVSILSVFDEMNQNNCSITLVLSRDSCYICSLPYPMNRFSIHCLLIVFYLPSVLHYKLKMSFHPNVSAKFISTKSLVFYDIAYVYI